MTSPRWRPARLGALRSSTIGSAAMRWTGLVCVGIVLTFLALALPTMVIVTCAGVAVVLGGMGWTWSWLTATPGQAPARATEFGLCAGLVGGAAALGLAAFALLFGPASVVVLPAGYAVAAMLFWILRAPSRPC
jgi:hypothetical protein